MAAGDILSCTVRPDGWSCDIVVSGSLFAVGAAYNFGSLGNSPATIAAPTFTMQVVSVGYSNAGVLGTNARTIYGAHVVRVPFSTATIAGSFTLGAFLDGEIATQAVSGATAILVGNQASGALLKVKVVTGTPTSTNVWSGGTSGATFTATALPVLLAAPSPDETATGTNLTMRVSLSECVFAKDNTGAGNSGTAPTVTIAAAWCTSGANTSNAITNLGVINNSTLAYPKVIGQWDFLTTPVFRRVSATFSMGFRAYSGLGIACVVLTATDAHADTITSIATVRTKALASVPNLYHESYQQSVSLASMVQGDDISLKAVAYPIIGDTPLDTSTKTANSDLTLGWGAITCTCDKTSALIIYAVVSSAGNDATAVISATLATAVASPFLTTGAALASGASVIYLRAGTYTAFLQSTPASVPVKSYCIEVSPYPTEAVTIARAGTSYYQYKATKLRWSGFTITSAGESYCIEGNNTTTVSLQFDSNAFTTTAYPPTEGLGYGNFCTIFTNNTMFGMDNFAYVGGVQYGYHFEGNSITGGVFKAAYGFVANYLSGTGTADQLYTVDLPSGTGLTTQNNFICINNKWMKLALAGTAPFMTCSAQALSGVASIGNIFEAVSNTGGVQLFSFGEGNTNQVIDSAILAHNTIVGERNNNFYNDVNTALHTNVFIAANAFRSLNIKTDTFTGGVGADGHRIGNWAQVNGVNWSDNRWDGTASGGALPPGAFLPDYYGINGNVVGPPTVFGEMLYTAEKSIDVGGGVGNGNYLPAAGSPLLGATLHRSYQTYDMEGNSV